MHEAKSTELGLTIEKVNDEQTHTHFQTHP